MIRSSDPKIQKVICLFIQPFYISSLQVYQSGKLWSSLYLLKHLHCLCCSSTYSRQMFRFALYPCTKYWKLCSYLYLCLESLSLCVVSKILIHVLIDYCWVGFLELFFEILVLIGFYSAHQSNLISNCWSFLLVMD